MSYFIVTTTAAAATNHGLFKYLGETNKRDTARSEAKRLGGVVKTAQEFKVLVDNNKMDRRSMPGYVPPEAAKPAASMLAMAEEIAKTAKTRNTIGKKVKAPKRVATAPEVLAAAEAFLAEGVRVGANKVNLVRGLALWSHEVDGVQLQRRDMFTVFKAVGVEIADATIATQFQVARSGKIPAARAEKQTLGTATE